eukprot:CAMPEP_0170168076 /NCGR_PEP_ID=MMETSP0040_2-20121228/1261_1 /TAXON_ID=641309 /ORGANISM="Lotharella oceanica, Strain CCMP622" /LENGTH=437 /DNA_ID=CAMNT_0010406253 /DNA_START=145 /DNA_END=1458 /DNA_ORIENTATION=-
MTTVRAAVGTTSVPPSPSAQPPKLVSVEAAEEIHLRKLLERFQGADLDNDGYLNPEEFRNVLECSDEFCLNEHWIPMERINQLISKYDKDGKGKIGVNEFIQVAEDHLLIQGAIVDYESAFNAMDRDEDGMITFDQVMALSRNLNQSVPEVDIKSALRMYGDGHSVSFAGFLGLAHEHFYELKSLLEYLELPTGNADIYAGQLSKEEIERIGAAWKERRARLCSTNMREELCEMIMLSNSNLATFKNVDASSGPLPGEWEGSSIIGDLTASTKSSAVIENFRVKPVSASARAAVINTEIEEKKSTGFKMPSFFSGSTGTTFGTVHEITSEEELDIILQEDPDQTVVLEVEFSWCRACKGFARKYTKYASLYPAVRFLKVMGNRNESTKRLCKERLGVTFSPVFFSFRGGRILATHRGINEEQFRDFIRTDLRPSEVP